MTVNKDVAKKVIEYTDKLTDKWLSGGKRDKLSVTVQDDAKYSFFRFAVEHNLLEDSKEHLHDLLIACPFHDDASPSCSLNDYKHRWHCFSCDRGGNIINLMAEYDRVVSGLSVSYYQKVNELLLNDSVMQATIGASSIYSNIDSFSLEGGLKRFIPNLNAKDMPKSYPEMASLMIKRGCTDAEIKYFILLMQAGEPVSGIYREIFKGERIEDKKEYDLQSMMLDV